MNTSDKEVDIQSEKDIVRARSRARQAAKKLDFSSVDQTRIATAVSEIARNALIHGGGGYMKLSIIDGDDGLEIIIVDHGKGIPDIERAMENGYSTEDSLGLGLGGAKRLVDEFEIKSEPGDGTRVTMRKFLQRRR